ncbi:MAG: CopD family protein [Thermoplasmata archaeon]
MLLLPLFTSGEAQGHAEYVSSDPPNNWVLTEPPTRLRVTLTEAIAPGTAGLRVTNATGVSFDPATVEISEVNPRGMVADVEGLGPDVYTVTWSVVSAVDGHFTAGSFSFGVLNPDGTLPGVLPVTETGPTGRVGTPPEIALRILSFLGLAVALGAVAFLSAVWRPAWASGRAPRPEDGTLYQDGTLRLLRLGRLGALVFAVAVTGWWILTLLLAPPSSPGDIVSSQFLLSLALRLGFATALILVLSLTIARLGKVTATRRPSPWVFLALLLGLSAVLAGSLGSHGAAAVFLSPLGALADATHLLGVSLWVGGLVAIVWVRSLLREDPLPERSMRAYRRFSRLAFLSVGLVLLAGITLSVVLVGSFEALFGTSYGLVVLSKASLFVPMAAVGAYNRYRLLPSPDPSTAVGQVVRNVRIEVVLGASILILAGLLTSMSPSLSLSGGDTSAPLSLSATDQGIRMDLDIIPYPTFPGVYVFSVLLFDAVTGAPYSDARNATLTLTHLDSALPPQEMSLPGPHGNHFGGESSALTQLGRWILGLRFVRQDGFDLTATFEITVGSG